EKRPLNQNKTELVLSSWLKQAEPEGTYPAESHLRYEIPPLAPRNLVWVHSVFSGSDFDKAYQIARGLAHDGKRQQAIWLTSHILREVPGHVDAEILMGRLLAWEGSFEQSARILEEATRKHPKYEDAYAALLDTYFWSGQHEKALRLQPVIEQFMEGSSTLQAKLKRSREALRNTGGIANSTCSQTAARLPAKKAERP
ncbi:MAG: hypothetical protein P8Z38_02325, partial [Robiginitalea sp.]